NAHCITEGKNGRLIVSYHNYIAYSDDGGATLVTSSTLGLSSFGIYTLLNAGTFGIYAFTNSGILRSRDNGETFLKVSTMQRQAAVYSERLGAIVCSGTYVVTHCIDGDNFFDVSGTPGGQKLSFSNIIENGTDF
ncbi:exo-alpha-sialidase, partial [Vibrio vulnificus]|uniref:sialidase family protein n=1 Tax=Vibrio vulnificus TaxID=672 RepID=UPI0019D4289D